MCIQSQRIVPGRIELTQTANATESRQSMDKTPALARVDRDDPLPRYLQAQEILISAIRGGMFPPGAKLPSTKDISTRINTSLITAHRALDGLVEQGWLRREVGRGTFVRDDVDPESGVQTKVRVALVFDRRGQVDMQDFYHGTLINRLRHEAARDTRPTEYFFHDDFSLRDSPDRRVAALCFHPPHAHESDVVRLSEQCPTVVIGARLAQGSVATVDADNRAGAAEAARHLLTLGHRRFLLVVGPQYASNSRDRAEGASEALAAVGIGLDGENLIESTDSVDVDVSTLRRLDERLRGPKRPTAVLAGGFYLALAVIQTAKRLDLAIPDDLSVVGFDDPPAAPLLSPALCTVRQPLEEMAAKAYELLLAQIMGDRVPRKAYTFPTRLLIRDSTRHPPAD